MEIHISGGTNNIRFSAAHFIPNIEKCSRLHGHDYSVDITLNGEMVDGVLIDYGIVKNDIRSIIEPIDHRVIVPSMDRYSTHRIEDGKCLVSFRHKEYEFPESDVFLLDADVSSSENLSQYFFTMLSEKLRQHRNIKFLSVVVYEGPGQGAKSEDSIEP
ncbi:MAG: 6-carboxytetrahydropterin synthase [Candidatus Thermoplasmatota archaeon]|nr:6-carboxytetrahydropterin synthase [Candidatus Thermoplasmatota archaeon]